MPALKEIKRKTWVTVNWIVWGSVRLLMADLAGIYWGKSRHHWKICINKWKNLHHQGMIHWGGNFLLRAPWGLWRLGLPWIHATSSHQGGRIPRICSSPMPPTWHQHSHSIEGKCLQEFNVIFVLISYMLEVKFKKTSNSIIHPGT